MAGKKEQQTNPGSDESGLLDPDGNPVVGGHNTDTGLDDPGDGPGTQPDVGIPDAGGGTAGPPELDDPKMPDPIGRGGYANPLLAPSYVKRPETQTEFEATTREVQPEELASHQLTGLLAGDSKYMRQARQEGLELGGGLGGTQGIRSAYSSAIKAGGPLAMADAQAYRDAAAQNMDALNSFGLANIQRQTQLELGTMDANTRLQTAHMNNTTQMSIAKMNDITNRSIANLNSETQIAITRLDGVIKGRLADQAFGHSQILNAELNQYQRGQIELRGEIDYERQERLIEANKEANYLQNYLTAYDGALGRIDALNGIEMDDAARARAQRAIWEGFDGQTLLMEALYPDVEPIRWRG
jgi:hypothetical protein